MKDNVTLFDPIQVEGTCAVMSGGDTGVKAAPLGGSDEVLGGSFHKDLARIANDRIPQPRGRGQNTKREEEINRVLSRIVVAEQWFCCLWGLVCVICGVYGLFVICNQDAPFAFIRWLGAVQGPILRSTAIACVVIGAVLVRCGLAGPGQPLVSKGQ